MIKKIVIFLILIILCLTLLPQSVFAHNPGAMVLDYNFGNQKLGVTITHNVADPNSHYIENVKVWNNDNLIINQDYTSQPSTSSFTYSYDITAVSGDVLKVTATCSISGNITRQILINDNEPTLDGIISNNEYEFSVSFGGGDLKLHWRVDGEIISMAIEGKTNGWVAIGFEPKKIMKDADMIFGWVTSEGAVIVEDTYSENETGPHPPDTELGGTDDILEFGGSENNGWTLIEFKRLLDTDDDFDKKLRSEGEIDVIWAMGSNDNFENKHSRVGSGTINLTTGEASEDIKLWPFHAFFMILGFLFMVKASIIAHFKKRIKWWLKAHKAINVFATIFAILGLATAIYMVGVAGSTHFRVPHAYIGLITIIFVIITPILGFTILKAKTPNKNLGTVHRAIGRITIILMLINILIGLSLVDII